MVLKNTLPKRNPKFDELNDTQLNHFREAVEAYNQVRADHTLLHEAYGELPPQLPDFSSEALLDHSKIVDSRLVAVLKTATRTAEDPAHALRLAAAAIDHWPLSNDHHSRAAASVIAADVMSQRRRITRLESHLRVQEMEERQQQEEALVREAMEDPDARQKAIRLIYDNYMSDMFEQPEGQKDVGHRHVVGEPLGDAKLKHRTHELADDVGWRRLPVRTKPTGLPDQRRTRLRPSPRLRGAHALPPSP